MAERFPALPAESLPGPAGRLLGLPDAGRGMAVRICAGRGAGKSRLMGRVIAFQDFVRGVPTIILDAVGSVIDNGFDKLIRLPKRAQQKLWERVRYVECAGLQGYVTAWPLYVRHGDESLYAISQRVLEVWRRADPQLQQASVLGFNALAAVATKAGMVLTALGLQITEAEDLVRRPEAWRARLAEAVRRCPEVAPAVAFFADELPRLPERERLVRTDAFLRKLAPFSLSPTLRAIHGAATPGIDWGEVVAQRQLVALDLRHIEEPETRRFTLLWLLRDVTDWLRRRGPGRHPPVSLLIDELTFLTSLEAHHSRLIADDLEELISRLSRNYALWLTVSHQEITQFDERLQRVLLTCGTQIFGGMSDPDGALTLAKRFGRYDPYLVKKTEYHETMYGTEMRTVEFSRDEQLYLASRLFLELPAFHFVAAVAPREGRLPTTLAPFSIARVDAGQYVDEALVAEARRRLMQRDGRPVDEVLAEIAARQATPRLKAAPAPARREALPPVGESG